MCIEECNTSETFCQEMYTYASFANKCIQKLKYEFTGGFFRKMHLTAVDGHRIYE